MRLALSLIVGLLAPACLPEARPPPRQDGATAATTTSDGEVDESQPMGGKSASETADAMIPIPTECAAADPCVPDPGFVKRLCGGSYPDVALLLMSRPPFTHMFLRGDVDGWNADGGASTRARLSFDEEVLVLRRRAAATNSIVVGGGASFLVMRWDGNCYTLEEGELTAKRPPASKHGPLPWRYYGERTKEALLKSPKVATAAERRSKECKGSTSGDVPRACEQADAALGAAVVAEVRGGLAIPTPDRRP